MNIYNSLFCLIATIIIELVISVVIGIRNKDLFRIVFINILTNIPINIIVGLLSLHLNYWLLNLLIVPILELVVIIVEGNYFKKLNNNVIGNYKLSILLNSFTYGYGIIITIIMRNI